MGSFRLPQKMMRSLGGLTIFERVLTRISRVDNIDRVVVCTPDTQENIPLQKIAKNFGFAFVVGPEHDVVSRFNLAMKKYPADYYIRVCADNPFISSKYIAQLVEATKQNEFDYASNQHTSVTPEFVDGLGAEIFSRKLGENVVKHAKTAQQKEHFFNVFHDKKNAEFSTLKLEPINILPEAKLDVDTEHDLTFLNEFVEKFNIPLDVTDCDLISALAEYIEMNRKDPAYS